MKNRNNDSKKFSVIFIIAVLVLSSTAVIGENINKQTKTETCLTEVSQTNTNTKIINKEPMTYGQAILWDNGLPDGANGLSCVYWPTHDPRWDRYIIDNFIVPEPGWVVNDGHFRIVTELGSGPEKITDIYVYFFKSSGPCEAENILYFTDITSFNASLTGNIYFDRPEIAVDCQFKPVILTPGEWWVCFQPQIKENCYWLTAPYKGCSVLVDYLDMSYPRWTWGLEVFGQEYDVSWFLTGKTYIKPEIEVWAKGGLGITIYIKNLDTQIPYEQQIQFEVIINATLMLLGAKNTLQGPLTIPAGETVKVKTDLVLGLGICSVVITADYNNDGVADAEATGQGIILGPFVFIGTITIPPP